MVDFGDKNTPHGQFYARHADEVPPGWWTARHVGLGESPFSALCDDRFVEVAEAVEQAKS